jgi:putative Holliday junction resolvase
MAGRLLGLDYGRRRIGVAVCDELGITVTPVGFVPRTSDATAVEVLVRLAVEEKATGFVLGLPLHASGMAGQNAAWVEAFRERLAAATGLPVQLVDERYSSDEAAELLREQGVADPAAGRVDATAAAIILRRYLAGEH